MVITHGVTETWKVSHVVNQRAGGRQQSNTPQFFIFQNHNSVYSAEHENGISDTYTIYMFGGLVDW